MTFIKMSFQLSNKQNLIAEITTSVFESLPSTQWASQMDTISFVIAG